MKGPLVVDLIEVHLLINWSQVFAVQPNQWHSSSMVQSDNFEGLVRIHDPVTRRSLIICSQEIGQQRDKRVASLLERIGKPGDSQSGRNESALWRSPGSTAQDLFHHSVQSDVQLRFHSTWLQRKQCNVQCQHRRVWIHQRNSLRYSQREPHSFSNALNQWE